MTLPLPSPRPGRWPLIAVGILLSASVLGTASHTQEPAVRSSKLVASEAGLPGMDRGLREHDAPEDPAARATRNYRARDGQIAGASYERNYAAGALIVKFKDGVDPSAVSSAMRAVSSSGTERLAFADFDIVEIPAELDAEVAARALRERPEVEYAQPRYKIHPALRPNDPLYDRQWNFPAIDMERAWDIQPTAGREITVAVLDTGVAFRTSTTSYANRSFRCSLGPGLVFNPPVVMNIPFAVAPELGDTKFVAPRDFIWDDALPFDLDGHGTHVSGTIGQLTNNSLGVAGMAYNVRIMPVKVLDGEWDCILFSPFEGTDDTLARGIRYAADNGANVINMSLGRTSGGPAPAVEDALRYAVSRGVFVAVAAGNNFESGNAPGRLAEIGPRIDGVITVGAVGRALERSYYSNTNNVEISAPGGDQRRDGTVGGVLQQTLDQDLLHTWEFGPARLTVPRGDAFTYSYFQGTSMATPHVAAMAAMLMQQGIKSPAAIEKAIKDSARDLGAAGVDANFGAGLIQPRAALRGLGLLR